MRLSVKHIKKDVLYIFSGRGGTWGGGGPHGAVEVIAQTESLNLFLSERKTYRVQPGKLSFTFKHQGILRLLLV